MLKRIKLGVKPMNTGCRLMCYRLDKGRYHCEKYCNFHTRKLVEITIFFAVYGKITGDLTILITGEA